MAVTEVARRARPHRWPGVAAWTLWALTMAVWLVIPWLDQPILAAGVFVAVLGMDLAVPGDSS